MILPKYTRITSLKASLTHVAFYRYQKSKQQNEKMKIQQIYILEIGTKIFRKCGGGAPVVCLGMPFPL